MVAKISTIKKAKNHTAAYIRRFRRGHCSSFLCGRQRSHHNLLPANDPIIICWLIGHEVLGYKIPLSEVAQPHISNELIMVVCLVEENQHATVRRLWHKRPSPLLSGLNFLFYSFAGSTGSAARNKTLCQITRQPLGLQTIRRNVRYRGHVADKSKVLNLFGDHVAIQVHTYEESVEESKGDYEESVEENKGKRRNTSTYRHSVGQVFHVSQDRE